MKIGWRNVNILSKLKAQKNLSNNKQIVADFILENPLKILEMSAKEVMSMHHIYMSYLCTFGDADNNHDGIAKFIEKHIL